MTRSEIAEVLRCAADLCLETIIPLRAACLLSGADFSEVAAACDTALGRPRSRYIEELHTDFLEAAQIIEDTP